MSLYVYRANQNETLCKHGLQFCKTVSLPTTICRPTQIHLYNRVAVSL